MAPYLEKREYKLFPQLGIDFDMKNKEPKEMDRVVELCPFGQILSALSIWTEFINSVQMDRAEQLYPNGQS